MLVLMILKHLEFRLPDLLLIGCSVGFFISSVLLPCRTQNRNYLGLKLVLLADGRCFDITAKHLKLGKMKEERFGVECKLV